MSQFSDKTKAAALALGLSFSVVGQGLAAEDEIYITEKINGGIAEIGCERNFPNLANGSNKPRPELVAGIDSVMYHGGQLSPTGFVIKSKYEREAALAEISPLNRPLMLYAADKYDNAADKDRALKELVAEAHQDMPAERWDEMAEKCRKALATDSPQP